MNLSFSNRLYFLIATPVVLNRVECCFSTNAASYIPRLMKQRISLHTNNVDINIVFIGVKVLLSNVLIGQY